MQASIDDARKLEILLRVRAGSIDESDAARAEIEACINNDLLEWSDIPGSYTTIGVLEANTAITRMLPSAPKIHPVKLTALGQKFVKDRIGFE